MILTGCNIIIFMHAPLHDLYACLTEIHQTVKWYNPFIMQVFMISEEAATFSSILYAETMSFLAAQMLLIFSSKHIRTLDVIGRRSINKSLNVLNNHG